MASRQLTTDTHARGALPPEHVRDQERGQRIERHHIAASGIGQSQYGRKLSNAIHAPIATRRVPRPRLAPQLPSRNQKYATSTLAGTKRSAISSGNDQS